MPFLLMCLLTCICLLILSLSYKLLSVSQLTRELNYTILMSSTGCVAQDAQTGTAIGHDSEPGGLYYVDERTLQS